MRLRFLNAFALFAILTVAGNCATQDDIEDYDDDDMQEWEYQEQLSPMT